MASLNSIVPQKLMRLIGTVKVPTIIDLRSADEVAADPHLIPTAIHVSVAEIETRLDTFASDKAVVAVCTDGGARSEGVAAVLRQHGISGEVLDGGLAAWRAEGLPLVPAGILPEPRGGRTVWVTRSRPKIDRIACPWLIRRFIDPSASFLFVAPARVAAVAAEFEATPFDMEDGFWTHRGDLCTFDVMVAEFGLSTEPLLRLATMVRAADTDRLDLIPEAPGLLAISLGLSRLYSEDDAQLEAGLPIYDALYHWCRDATGETHGWPPRGAR